MNLNIFTNNKTLKFRLKTIDYKNKIFIFEPNFYFFNFNYMTNMILQIKHNSNDDLYQLSMYEYELRKFNKNKKDYLQHEIFLSRYKVIFRYNLNLSLKEIVVKL